MMSPWQGESPPAVEAAVIDAGSAAWRLARALGVRLEVLDDLADALEALDAAAVLAWTGELARQAPAVLEAVA